MAFESETFANAGLLVEALNHFGFETVTQGDDLALEGWDKRDIRRADIVIRRSDTKKYRLLGDIGFQRTSKGFVAVLDDMDLNYQLGSDFVTRLQTNYHEAAARKMAKALGGKLIREQIGKTIKIRIKY